MDAYLDIETTGLSPNYNHFTVVGICIDYGDFQRLVQVVGENITATNVLEPLDGVETLYTYNGSRFDLPFLTRRLGIDLEERYRHRDLMYSCWARNRYGGLKAVERRLGICRQLPDIDGREAAGLWQRYRAATDRDALQTLLEYNREDVLNLKTLRLTLNSQSFPNGKIREQAPTPGG